MRNISHIVALIGSDRREGAEQQRSAQIFKMRQMAIFVRLPIFKDLPNWHFPDECLLGAPSEARVSASRRERDRSERMRATECQGGFLRGISVRGVSIRVWKYPMRSSSFGGCLIDLVLL